MMAGWWTTGARGWSLRTLLGVSITIILLLFGWTAWRERTRTLDDAERTAVRTVAALHEQAVKVLETHELVKVRIGTECPDERHDVAERLPPAVRAELAQVLGRTILLYRRHPKEPKIQLPRAAG